MIPVLMITYNRLEYTKQALKAVLACGQANLFIIDNGSTDGTKQWLYDANRESNIDDCPGVTLMFNEINIGIAGAMNQFLEKTKNYVVVGKVDNDTIIQRDFIKKMLRHMDKADVVQAKHPLIPASGVGTFDEWTSKMPAAGALRYNHFVGGSGILFKRQLVDRIPETEWKLGGWRQWQRDHPELKKAFATDVEIELLDTNEQGVDYSKYPDYYKETGRV